MKESIVNALPINRVVIMLTPVFTAGAAVGTAWLGKHFPGLPVPTKAQLVLYEGAGASAALTMAAGWLKGHHNLESDLRAAESVLTTAANMLPTDKEEADIQPQGA